MIGVAELTKPKRKVFAVGSVSADGMVQMTWIPDGVTGLPKRYRIHRRLLHKALDMARGLGDARPAERRVELASYLNALTYASEVLGRENPRPDGNLNGGREEPEPEGSRLNDALEGIDLPECVQVVPTCPSCHSPDDVELADLPGGDVECWCCAACGRAFREELVERGIDACGACIGTGQITWDESTGGGNHVTHAESCHFCSGKGR